MTYQKIYYPNPAIPIHSPVAGPSMSPKCFSNPARPLNSDLIWGTSSSWGMKIVFGLGCGLASMPNIALSRHRKNSMSLGWSSSKSRGNSWTYKYSKILIGQYWLCLVVTLEHKWNLAVLYLKAKELHGGFLKELSSLPSGFHQPISMRNCQIWWLGEVTHINNWSIVTSAVKI